MIPRCEHKSYSSYTVNSHTTPADGEDGQESETDSSYKALYGDLSKWKVRPSIGSSHEGDPESPSVGTSSSLLSGIDGEDYANIRVESPPPLDETPTDIKDERRYRMLLQHEFHPSCTFLPSNPI